MLKAATPRLAPKYIPKADYLAAVSLRIIISTKTLDPHVLPSHLHGNCNEHSQLTVQ